MLHSLLHFTVYYSESFNNTCYVDEQKQNLGPALKNVTDINNKMHNTV